MKKYPIRIVLVGTAEETLSLKQKLNDTDCWEIVGKLYLEEGEKVNSMACLSLEEIQNSCDVVVVCVESVKDHDLQMALLDLPLHGVDVLNRASFLDKYYREISLDFLNFQWMTSFPTLAAESGVFFSKKCFDMLCAVIVLSLTLPLWPVIILVIYLQDFSSPFYSQVRVGHYGKKFKIYKFRTMIFDSEKNGAQWAAEEDERITAVGQFLRKSRLDELPQLINVLKGEMSFVGPRPERPEIEEALKEKLPLYKRRHLVPPGLTGWAQINYGYGSSIGDSKRKLEYDLYYIKHISFVFDLKVLMRTIPLIMKGSR